MTTPTSDAGWIDLAATELTTEQKIRAEAVQEAVTFGHLFEVRDDDPIDFALSAAARIEALLAEVERLIIERDRYRDAVADVQRWRRGELSGPAMLLAVDALCAVEPSGVDSATGEAGSPAERAAGAVPGHVCSRACDRKYGVDLYDTGCPEAASDAHRATRAPVPLEPDVEEAVREADLIRRYARRVLPPADVIAQCFHETYERLAPDFGYRTRTREASAKPWADVPEQNRALMVATVAEVRAWLTDATGATPQRPAGPADGTVPGYGVGGFDRHRRHGACIDPAIDEAP